VKETQASTLCDKRDSGPYSSSLLRVVLLEILVHGKVGGSKDRGQILCRLHNPTKQKAHQNSASATKTQTNSKETLLQQQQEEKENTLLQAMTQNTPTPTPPTL